MRCVSTLFLGVLLLTAVVRADEVPPGKPLEFEVTILHLRSVEAIPAEQRSLSGGEVLEAIAGWRKAGKIERMTTMRMSALENQKASVQIGEMAQVVVGRSFNASRGGGPGGGGGAPFGQTLNTQMEQHGTLIECTGRLLAGPVIEVQISAEQTRPGRTSSSGRVPEAAGAGGDAAAPPGISSPGQVPEISPPGRTITNAKTVVLAKSGECKIVGAVWNEGSDGATATLVLFVPRIVVASAK